MGLFAMVVLFAYSIGSKAALSVIHEYDVILKKIAGLDWGRAIVLIVLFYNMSQNSGFTSGLSWT